MTKPVRLQLSRKKGFNLQALSRATNGLAAVNVARPSKWGNPIVVGSEVISSRGNYRISAAEAVERYREIATRIDSPEDRERLKKFGTSLPPDLTTIVRELRGKNLACWCKIISPDGYVPCHADVLLSLANDLPMGDVVSENSRWAKGQAVR